MAVDKKKALETALASIEKQFGKGAVMKLGQNSALNVEAISTGSLGLDLALGRNWGVSRRSSTWSTLSTRFTRRHSAWT